MPEWAWPSSGIVYLFALLATSQQQQLKNLIDAFHGFMLIKIKNKLTKAVCTLHFKNKCIINKRHIPEHQNKLNIYDLQKYDFFANFFQPKKNS